MYKLLALCLLLASSISAFSQESKTIKGSVYYKESGEPVPFAYVKIRDVAFGTVTDPDGTFSLTIPPEYGDKILDFSYLGLNPASIEISKYITPVKIYLETDVKQLYAVVVTGKRSRNPKGILKEVVKAIPENYIHQDYDLTGFYREYVEEHGRPVKYADASFLLNLKAHAGEIKKSKQYENAADPKQAITVGAWTSRSSSLHRWHFHQQVLKGEKALIMNARASDDLNTTQLLANIQAGPLSALTKDRVKYPTNFMTDYGKYDYELLDVVYNEEPHFLITFKPNKPPQLTSEVANATGIQHAKSYKKIRQAINNQYKLSGTIMIRKEDLAIVEMDYAVPAEFKAEICGYRGWAVRHFDFNVSAKYRKTEHGYVLDYLKHADEFIVEDTVNKVRVPYAAISELYTQKVEPSVRFISEDENFSNSDYNHLFDLPDGYDKPYWQAYEATYPYAKVPSAIEASLSRSKPLEIQFANKLVKDTTLTPPIAPKTTYAFTVHGQKIQDEYVWLKDTINPMGNKEVIQYLTSENAYLDNHVRPLKNLRKDLYKELKSYVQEEYTSLPYTENGYAYYLKYETNLEYPIYYRQDTSSGSTPQVLIDVNEYAKDKNYYSAGSLKVSPDNQLLTYQENTDGTDRWVLKFKNLQSGEIMSDSIEYIGSMEWYSQSKIFYTKVDPKTYRTGQLYSYDLNKKESTLIYEELDKLFSIGLRKSRSKEFLFMSSSKSTQTEIWFLKIGDPNEKWTVVAPRRDNHLYSIVHYQDKFLIVTNDRASNNRVMETLVAQPEEKNWREILPTNEDVEILSIMPFSKYIVYEERHGLEYKIRIENLAEAISHYIKKDEHEALFIGRNTDFETDSLQFSRSMFNRPTRIYNYHMKDKKSTLKKITGKGNLLFLATIKTLMATAVDGTQIPITILYNKLRVKELTKAGKTPPLYITGYGAYGSRNIPTYNPYINPIVNNGAVYAIAHVRGGGDLGQSWYDDGKMLNKKNSFTDFIACTEFLITEGYGQKGQVIAEGGSAGGLLMGAVANMRPDLFGMIILDVPFVDVVNTMLDEKLPLTIQEYEEWGNPHDKKYFKYIQSYSPYDNVKKQPYPMMYFTTGINDTRVGYWEPAKMVARLREYNTSKNEILLHTDFSSGHGGASGRYASLQKLSFKYALILDYLKKLN